MAKRRKIYLDFVIDRLTNSIENIVTGDSFETIIQLLSQADLKNVTKRKGWVFNWKAELQTPEKRSL